MEEERVYRRDVKRIFECKIIANFSFSDNLQTLMMSVNVDACGQIVKKSCIYFVICIKTTNIFLLTH